MGFHMMKVHWPWLERMDWALPGEIRVEASFAAGVGAAVHNAAIEKQAGSVKDCNQQQLKQGLLLCYLAGL